MVSDYMAAQVLEAVRSAQEEWHPTRPQHQDIAKIIESAIVLEDVLYEGGDHSKALFALRKSLEGVFGHCYSPDEEAE